jgi:DNA-binding transcriptional regulator YiaG
MTFADQLKFYRRELDLTQAELSELLDVPKRTLWDWESGRTEPLPVAQEGAIARLDQLRIEK